MRLYLPATVDELDRAVLPVPRRAHAVTGTLRDLLPEEDEEGMEFAAMLMAADDALVLLAGRPGAPELRVVLTVDVPDSAVQPAPQPAEGDEEPASLVTLVAEVAVVDLVCAHVDEPAARGQVHRALEGDDAALDDLAERDLLWYDVSELADIPR